METTSQARDIGSIMWETTKGDIGSYLSMITHITIHRMPMAYTSLPREVLADYKGGFPTQMTIAAHGLQISFIPKEINHPNHKVVGNSITGGQLDAYKLINWLKDLPFVELIGRDGNEGVEVKMKNIADLVYYFQQRWDIPEHKLMWSGA